MKQLKKGGFLTIIFTMDKVKKYWPHILSIVFLIGLNVVTYKDYGIVWDEKYYFDQGKYYLDQILRSLGLASNLTLGNFKPIPLHIKAHGVLFDILAVVFIPFFKTFTFEKYHLIKAMMAVPIFILLGWIINKLIGRKASLVAIVLLLVFPRFYGEIFHNAIDVATTLVFVLNIAYFIYFIKSNQNGLKQLGLALVLALALSQRLLLGYLLGLEWLIILAVDWHKKKPTLKFIGKTILIFSATIFFMHLFHPYLFGHPLRGLYDMVVTSKKFPYYAAVFFEGKLILASALPWYYLPKFILITTPLATLFLFFVGLGYIAHLIFKKKVNFINRLIYLYLVLILAIPFLIIFFLKPTLYDGWRQMLFLTVPIIIMASFGFQALRGIKIKPVKFLLTFLVAASLSLATWQAVKLYPYQYIYFNELVRGLPGAYNSYETDYAGAAFKEAIEWFNKNIYQSGTTYKIATSGYPFAISYYFKDKTALTENPVKGDYYFSYTRWFLHLIMPGTVVHQVERDGVPLIFIKKL